MSVLSSFGGGGGSSAIDNILAQFNSQQSKATAAQAAQFDQLIKAITDLGTQTGSTFQDALSRIEGLGTTASARLQKTGEQTAAAGQQQLISSGLSNTTIPANLRRAVAEDTEFQQQGIDESVGLQQSQLLTQQAGNQTQIGGLLANAIGGQNIEGPDLGLFASLIQQAAAAGDPNQKTNVFGGVNTAALNAPNSAFQRPTKTVTSGSPQTASSSTASPGGAGASTAQGARVVTNPNAAGATAGGGVSVSGTSSPTRQLTNNPCPNGGRLFPGIGCF